MKKPCYRRLSDDRVMSPLKEGFSGSFPTVRRRRMCFQVASFIYKLKPGVYVVIHYQECEFGECVAPKLERMEFETREEAKLYAASKGYEWEKDPFAPGC